MRQIRWFSSFWLLVLCSLSPSWSVNSQQQKVAVLSVCSQLVYKHLQIFNGCGCYSKVNITYTVNRTDVLSAYMLFQHTDNGCMSDSSYTGPTYYCVHCCVWQGLSATFTACLRTQTWLQVSLLKYCHNIPGRIALVGGHLR